MTARGNLTMKRQYKVPATRGDPIRSSPMIDHSVISCNRLTDSCNSKQVEWYSGKGIGFMKNIFQCPLFVSM